MSEAPKKCFVIQRFDNGTYDKRYRETFAPAIKKGGAEPIRADEVLGTRPVVEKIEQGLRAADVAFAEVSEDNPNVFLELGYALALGIPTVIVCDRHKRAKLPFDIAHRPVNFYATEAQSDWEKISDQVTKEITAALLESRTKQVALKADDKPASGDIDDIKGACLLELLDQSMRSPVGSTLWQLQKDLSSVNISSRMIALAVASLVEDGLIERHELADQDGDPYNSFALSDHGQRHLLRNYGSLMRTEKELIGKPTSWNQSRPTKYDDLDDDIPF